MSINSKSLLALFLVFLAGSTVGFLVGGYTGTNFGMKIIVNGMLNKDAKDVKTQLNALRALHGGDSARAMELLEAAIDDQLVIFDPREPYPADQAATEKVDEAIRAAYEYRRQHPRQSGRPQVDAMVRSLFDKHGLVN